MGFKPKPKNFSIGGDIMPKTASLERVRKWPKYVRIQRQRKVLLQRLKKPAAVNVFTQSADKNLAKKLFGLCMRYRPEEAAAKKQRLKAAAEAVAAGKTVEVTKKPTVKFGFNHVTDLIESKKARLVLIANDVDPLELVLWMPTLCHTMDVPFAIVKGKSRLGRIVRQKTATCLALTAVNQGDLQELNNLIKTCRTEFNERLQELRKRGGMQLGIRALHRNQAIEKAREAEERKRKAQ